MFNFLVCREDKELAEIFYERGENIIQIAYPNIYLRGFESDK